MADVSKLMENLYSALEEAAAGYIEAKKDKSNIGKRNALLKSAADIIAEHLASNGFGSLRLEFSAGIGKFAHVPWIATFDASITTKASEGHYPVLLFGADMKRLYLSYSVANGEGKVTKQEKEEKRTLAETLRSRLKSLDRLGFTHELKLNSPGNRARGYERGSIYSKSYDIKSLRTSSLAADIISMCAEYAEIAKGLTEEEKTSYTNTMDLPHEQRLICALAAKPFVILAGGTGTGKSMAALNVAKKLAPSVNNYEFVAVGADWTDTRPLLGYENILRAETTYTVPKTLEIIIEAGRKPQEPFFIILDEMNLSHVERYFSDFLSIMEAKKVNREASTIKLHSRKDGMRPTDDNLRGCTGAADDLRVPDRIEWPSNLFVIGTVNVDETTHMFSPKVLDRAHVIEFKPDRGAVKDGMVASPAQASAGEWLKIGSDMVSLARGFAEAEAAKRDFSEALSKPEQDEAIRVIMGFWDVLEGTRFKFSYRTGQEALRYVRTVKWLARRHTEAIGGNTSMDALLDLAILQKILPKINGSAETLMTRAQSTKSEQDDKQEPEPLLKALLVPCEKLKESAAKLNAMQATLEAEHFVSFIQ